MQAALAAMLWLCAAATGNNSAHGVTSSSSGSESTVATCRDRFGPLPVSRFALRSCAMCYVYLGNATHSRRLRPVRGHYEALMRIDANRTVAQVRSESSVYSGWQTLLSIPPGRSCNYID